MSRDPIGEMGGLNLYAFVGNDPTNLIDPYGLVAVVDDAVAIYAFTAVVGAAIIYFTSPAWDEASRGMADATSNFISNLNFEISVGSKINLINPNIAGNISPCPMGPDDDRDPSQDKRLTKGDIRKLKKSGYDIHDLKPGKHGSRFDLFKDRQGNIYVKPKSGIGPGDPTGINIYNL